MTDLAEPEQPDVEPRQAPSRDLRAAAAKIDAVLHRQHGRIRARFWLYGLGLLIAGIALSLLGYFAADRLLRIPAILRVAISLGLLVWLGFAIRRWLIYPLQRPFERGDVAIAIERNFPELHQRVVSALQLRKGLDHPDILRNQSPAMVREVVAEAADALESVPVDQIVDSRRAFRIGGAAVVAVLVLLSVAALEAEAFGVFAKRVFGASVDYPRATQLLVELPSEIDEFRIEYSAPASTDGSPVDRTAVLTMAAGADLPVLVRAEGVVPREVELVVETEAGFESAVAMAPRPGARDRFRHVFRRVRGSFEFYARGGDDPDGDLRVVVRTIEPPLVATLEAIITPPAYTQREPETRSGGAIEGVIGSSVDLAIGTTSPVASATVEFLDTGRTLELTPLSLEDEFGPGRRFEGSFPLLEDDRYAVRLTNSEGMTNPRPGTYPIVALRDFEPVGRLLSPDPSDVLVALPTARVPIRLEARDDFGLATVALTAGLDRADQRLEIPLFDATAGEALPVRDRVFVTVVELSTLASVGPAPAPGDAVELVGVLTDRREPEPQTVELTGRRIFLVDEAELSRRAANLFRRVRDDVERALSEQVSRREATQDEIDNPSNPSEGRPARVVSLQVGQIRIGSTLERIHDGLMRAFDLHLFNDLEGPDSRAARRAQALYIETQKASDERRARLPEYYRELSAARTEGRIGPMELVLDPILQMVQTADLLANQQSPSAASAIETATVASDSSALRRALEGAAATQDEMIQGLTSLLDRLDEWNEIQDVVQQVRSLRDAQREIEARTRSAVDGR